MIFPIILIGLGSLLILYLWWEQVEALASRQWPMTTGTIVRSEVRIEPNDDCPDSHFPVIEYEYRAKDRAYRSNRLRYGSWSATEQEASAYTSQFPVGSMVDVYFSPHAPERSVLIPGMLWSDRIFPILFVSVLFLGSGLFMALRWGQFLWNLVAD